MSIYIGIEDLAANALIELAGEGQREVLFKDLDKYGAAVVRILGGEGEEASLSLSPALTANFLHTYAAYFKGFENGKGEKGIRLTENVNTEELWVRFRSCLSVKALLAFTDEAAVQALSPTLS